MWLASFLDHQVLEDLAAAGYWGLLIDPEYGGRGASFGSFARFLIRVAAIEPSLSGLASVHGCIGAVDPIRTFGTPAQKERYLPLLASGRRLSAFALTEPCAGPDLTALRTRAELDGDHYVLNGEKLFITNAVPGRTVGLVCRIDDRPAALIVDLLRVAPTRKPWTLGTYSTFRSVKRVLAGAANYNEFNNRAILADWTYHPQRLWEAMKITAITSILRMPNVDAP